MFFQVQTFDIMEVDKKEDKPLITDLSIEAELELLKLENNQTDTTFSEKEFPQGQKFVDNLIIYADKLKRDSNNVNVTDNMNNSTDEGQKEIVFGNVNVDPILYLTEFQNKMNETVDEKMSNEYNKINVINTTQQSNFTHHADITRLESNDTVQNKTNHSFDHQVKELSKTKLNPVNDYADISEAIKLISRYAEVTTDDNFAKDHKKNTPMEEGILGTRTKLQHRRNKLPSSDTVPIQDITEKSQIRNYDERVLLHKYNPKNDVYYRYPWNGQVQTPPPDYPFRHLQDYWPGRKHIGGVYNSAHENPRRHHHSYPHNSLRPRGYTDNSEYPGIYASLTYSGTHPAYAPHALVQRRAPPAPQANNHDLYSLLGLRHWFSSDSSSKR